MTLLEKTKEEIDQLEKQIEASRDEEGIGTWKERKMSLEVGIIKKDKEMKGVRTKILKHAMKIHKERRIFIDSCLREKGETQEGREMTHTQNQYTNKNTRNEDTSKNYKEGAVGTINEKTSGALK